MFCLKAQNGQRSNGLRKDIITTEYFQDNERFADFFNGYVFQGKRIIQPEHLTEQEIRESWDGLRAKEKITVNIFTVIF